MKNCKNIPGYLLAKISAAGLLCLLISSCLKENTNNNYTPPTALLSFIQASPDEPPVDFFLNSNKVNNNSIYFGNNIDYVSAYAGTRTANFYTAGTANILFSGTISLNPNTAYSLFLANKSTSPEIVLLTDTLNAPPSGKAGLRFINLSPDASNVSLAIQVDPIVISLLQLPQTLVTNEPYKGYSTFIPVAGKTTYNFEVIQTGTNTVLATLPGVALDNGFVYTIWFGGLVASTNNNDKLSVNIVTNAFF
ncbi:MAG TPA: DUF4397 domain-containing protein [Mucilaginibacter sp.]